MYQKEMEGRRLIQEILQNAEAVTTECYKMIYKLIKTPAFRKILLHSTY